MRSTGSKARAGALSGAVAIALSFAAQAQDLTFDIPAGDLNAALTAYSKQTGQQVVFKIDDLKGKTTPGVHGAMTSEQALAALLAGTGLKVQKDSSGAIAIFPAEAVAGGASTETAGSEQKLEEVIVTATAISSIYVTSRSATRLDTDPMKLPMSISAVQGDLMRMQQSRTLTDVLNNVPGVDVSGYNNITMRGFTASVARNGTIQTGSLAQFINQRPTVSVDRIEVVKGPEQIMQGSSAGIGGTVNQITKLPEAQPSAYLGTAIGSDGYWRLDADLNDTLLGDDGNRLMGRLVGSPAGAGETDVGDDGASNDFASTGLRWADDDWGSDLSAVYEYNASTTPNPGIVVATGDSFHSGMKEWALAAKNAYTKLESNTFDLNLTQRLRENWALGMTYIWNDSSLKRSSTTPIGVLEPNTALAWQSKGPGLDFDSSSNDLKVDIRGAFETGPVAHRVMLAYDYNGTDANKSGGLVHRDNYYTDLETGEQTFVPRETSLPGFRDEYVETGVLLVDQVNWNAWSGLVGVRWASYDDTSWVPGIVDSRFKSTGDETLPQYGLVYQIRPDVSLYASGGNGYQSNAGLPDWEGAPLPNETSTQYEAGVKALLLDRQIAVTLALYRIRQVNVSTLDWEHQPDDGSFLEVYTTIPGLTSKGVEFEVSGQPIRGLQLRANYTYTQQQDNHGEPPYSGYVPSSFDLWAQYWISREPGQGFWGGFGLTAKNSVVQPTGGLNVPGFTTFDLQAGYSSGHWNAIAGFKNVADIQTFYPTRQDGQFAAAQPGASFTFDLSYQF